MSARPLLIFMAMLGAWNIVSLIGRIYCREPIAWRFVPQMIIGTWAAAILITGVVP